jgi:hypothetical protein
MSKLFICEKIDQAQKVSFVAEKNDILIIIPAVVSYSFKYPETLSFGDIPSVDKKPKYKPALTITNEKLIPYIVRQIKDNIHSSNLILHDIYRSLSLTDEILGSKINDAHEFLSSFDEIIYACDADHTGTRGFDLFFSNLLKINDLESFTEKNNIKVTAMVFRFGLDSKSTTEAYSSRKSFFSDDYIISFRKTYCKKDYFEFNYNINSLMLFGKCYKEVFGNNPNVIITKNQLSILYKCAEVNIEEDKLHRFMSDNEIGSLASRGELIKNLLENGFIEPLIEFRSNDIITLTSNAIKFLSLLAKKTNDPHLPQRFDKDIYNNEQSLSDFKEKYQRYLTTVFGKQKRFMNKNI